MQKQNAPFRKTSKEIVAFLGCTKANGPRKLKLLGMGESPYF